MSQVSITIRDEEGRRSAKRIYGRILDVLTQFTQGFALMSAKQDRFEASFKAYQDAVDAKIADQQKQIDDLKAAPAADTSASDTAFDTAADALDKATAALKGNGSSPSSSGFSGSPSSAAPLTEMDNGPAAGVASGSTSDALASGSTGTGSPSPIVSVS